MGTELSAQRSKNKQPASRETELIYTSISNSLLLETPRLTLEETEALFAQLIPQGSTVLVETIEISSKNDLQEMRTMTVERCHYGVMPLSGIPSFYMVGERGRKPVNFKIDQADLVWVQTLEDGTKAIVSKHISKEADPGAHKIRRFRMAESVTSAAEG